MAKQNVIIRMLDWFVPGASYDDREQLMRCRLLVIISVLAAIIWVPVVIRFASLSILIGIISGVFLLFMPFFLKRTGSLFWATQGIVLVITLSNFYRAYWEGGYDSITLWWNAIGPVIAVLLWSGRNGFLWFLVSALGVIAFYFLESAGIQLPGSEVVDDSSRLINILLLSILLTAAAFFLESSKNLVMDVRKKEVDRSLRFTDNMKNIAQQIKRHSAAIFSSSQGLTGTLVKMKVSAEEIDRVAQEAAGAANHGAETVQQLSSSLYSTVKRIKELEHSSLMTEEHSSQATDTIRQSIRAMTKINESRQEFDTILQAITDIADSAHLLSLNAAIEAAKAGEFGKGFFVVVEEIRDLAQRSNDAVVDIRKVIKKGGFIISRSKNVIVSIEEVFNSVIAEIENITAMLRNLASVLEVQNIGIREIVKNSQEITDTSDENTTLIRALKSSIEVNTNTAQNLHQIAEQLESQQVGLDE